MGSREVDMNGDRCSFEEDEVEFPKIFDNCKDCGIQYEIHDQGKHCDCGNTNEKTKLPITAILEERAKTYNQKNDNEKWGDYEVFIVQEIEEMLPQVRTLEEAQQKKAKEEEKDRIVGILKSIHNDSEILASKYECSQEGFEYGIQETSTLEKVISLITSNQ